MHKLVFVLFALALVLARPGAGTCGPLLNEVMADPAADWDGNGSYNYRNDEWVEIVNPGPGTLDLSGYYLGDEAGGRVFGFAGLLGPGQVQVVYGSQAVAWETANGEATTGLRLGNDGDTVQLLQLVSGALVTVDAYTYNSYEAEDDRSSGRMPDGGSAWQMFDALNPYGGTATPAGNGRPPTPGTRNDGTGNPPTPVEQRSWSRIKTLYSGL